LNRSLAVTEQNSKGRRYPEPEHAYRTAFERDRDRIIHCSAFRRLEGKTQVFTPHINDHYRTRFTHSMEVAQIGRTISKALLLNESLTEAVCLGHDLGHSPFGHTGEAVLDNIMENFGGFEHNAQTLRIVDLIERPYPDFVGLNLMYETRLALAKHRSLYDNPKIYISDFTEANCPLEGQVADLADRIAYNCHDLEDGLRAKLLTYEMIMQLGICAEAAEKCRASQISDGFVKNTRIAKTIIDILVGDCIETSRGAIETLHLSDLQQVLGRQSNVISLSAEAEETLAELEKFLNKNMYEHPEIKSVSVQVEGWLQKVFDKFRKNPQLMPKFYQSLIEEFGLERTVCDYISGMTDWYCRSMIEN
jgi:dGTPase